MTRIHYRAADIGCLKISYREAGQPEAPTLLLHGFPTAGHMFRDLIPLLADRLHLVAPDLPGFGQSDLPHAKRGHFALETHCQEIAGCYSRLPRSNYWFAAELNPAQLGP